MQGVTTQVSAPNSIAAWSTVLKKNPDTRGSAPSLLRILVILFHTSLSLKKNPHRRGPAIVRRQNHPPQLSEGVHHLQAEPIGSE